MPLINLNDIDMYYEVSGTNGIPVVLIHGVTISHILWELQVPILEPHFKVINLDLRNHGNSSKLDMEITMELLADDVKQLLDKLEIKEAIIIGESMGCFVSMEFTLKYQEMTKGLVLSCGARAYNDDIGAKSLLDGWLSHLQNDIDQFIEKDGLTIACKKCREIEAAKGIFEEYEKMVRSYPKYSMDRVIKGIQNFNVKDRLKEIECPTLIIHGKRDRVIPKFFAEEVHRLIKNSELFLIDGCHFALVHDFNKFNQILLEFLKKLSLC